MFIIGPPMVDQAESGPHNYTLPVMVACQVWQVIRHVYPIIHSPSEVLKAIHVTQVHPLVSSPKSVTLLLLATMSLHTVEQHYLEDFISNNTLSIYVICSHSFVHIKQFIEHIQNNVWTAACPQHINGGTQIPYISQHLKVGYLHTNILPQVLITLAEFAYKAWFEKHTKSENESQII